MVTERTEDTFKRQFMAHISTEDRASVAEIKLVKKNMAVIYCNSWEECKRILDKIKDTKFENEKVYFSLFSEDKPKTN